MSEKIRGFIRKFDLDKTKLVCGNDDFVYIRFSKNKTKEKDAEIEISIIEPVYEYQFLLMGKVDRGFLLSGGHYKDIEDCRNSIHTTFEAIRLIEETKRIRK